MQQLVQYVRAHCREARPKTAQLSPTQVNSAQPNSAQQPSSAKPYPYTPGTFALPPTIRSIAIAIFISLSYFPSPTPPSSNNQTQNQTQNPFHPPSPIQSSTTLKPVTSCIRDVACRYVQACASTGPPSVQRAFQYCVLPAMPSSSEVAADEASDADAARWAGLPKLER